MKRAFMGTFKVIYRIAAILLVAGVVVGGLFWLANSSSGQAWLRNLPGGLEGRGGFDRGFQGRAQATGLFNTNLNQAGGVFAQPAFRGGGDFGGRGRRINVQGALIDMAGKVGLVALMTLAVVLVRKLIGFIPRRKARKGVMIQQA